MSVKGVVSLKLCWKVQKDSKVIFFKVTMELGVCKSCKRIGEKHKNVEGFYITHRKCLLILLLKKGVRDTIRAVNR